MADEEQKNPKSRKKKAVRKADEDPVGKVYDARLARRLARYLRPYWVQAAIASISVSLKAACDVTGPYLVKVAVDRYMMDKPSVLTDWITRRLPSDPAHGVTVLAAVYLVMLVASYLFAFVQTYLMQWTGQKIMFDLRRDIFRHMQQMHVGFFDANPVGRLVTRLTSDVDAINDRNQHFNRKLERSYGTYTAEIKANLERGTALPEH